MNLRTAALVAVVVALVNLQPAHGYVHTNIGSTAETTLSDDCQSQYNDLLASIPVPPEPLLDAGELSCTDQISNATANTDGVYCPSQAVLVACFQLNQTAWTNLVGNCDLFTSAPNCLNGGVADAITGSACQRPRQSNGWWLFSATQGKFAIEQYDYGTGIVPNAGSDWQTVQGEGSRRLLTYPYQRGYAQRRRELLQTGESEGGGSGEAAGCFPDLYTQQDFINWLDGSYIEPTFGGNTINPIGVILWLVHAIGILAMSAF
ncbi:hypothetical protein WJX79_006430 [Trebouxia sp. C0005]